MSNPLVSVIIPVFNEDKVIERNLNSIKAQTYRNVEIIVVDDGSSDRTVELSKQITPLVFVRSHAERSVQRNFGASKAKGKYLLFLDADMELTSKVISECVRKFEDSERVGGISIPEESVGLNFWEKAKSLEREIYNLEGDIYTDAARFFQKSLFVKIGGYDESITGPEDWDLPDRLVKSGHLIARVRSKIIHHERIKSLYSLAKKKFYYGIKSHRYFKKHKLGLVSPKTIYFLRPVFYKNWKLLVSRPFTSIGMFLILLVEQVAGGIGFTLGKVLDK